MPLPRSAPSAHAVNAAGLLAFVDAVESRDLGLHSLMIARHGHVIAEGWWTPYSADRVHLGYSLSKTFTATTIGLLAGAGLLDVDAPVLPYFPEIDTATVSERWRRVTIAHCLSMSVGHDYDAGTVLFVPGDFEPGASFVERLQRLFSTELAAEPGSLFTYNQLATYLLSLIVTRVTGQPLHAVALDRFVERLGAHELPWHTDPFGFDLGFSGVHVTTETILGLAQLALDRGSWNEEQLLDPTWFDRATMPFAPVVPDPAGAPDWQLGYGFSYWMQRSGFRGDGAFGQFAITLPDFDVAIAITAEQPEMQATIDAIFEFIVPAIDQPGSSETDDRLAERLTTLEYPPLAGDRGSDLHTFTRDAESDLAAEYGAVTVSPLDAGHRVAIDREGTDLAVLVGNGEWLESVMEVGGHRLPVVASGGWLNGQEFVAAVRMIETPHQFTIHADTTTGSAVLRWNIPPLSGPDPMYTSVR